MYKPLTFFAALLIAATSFAQNIVVNPQFEQFSVCPDYNGQINRCISWQNIGLGTSDYFNACDTAVVDVPLNNLGYQLSSSGDAYGGLLVFSLFAQNYREYIRGQVVNMQAGQLYKVSIKVSLPGRQRYAADGLGILFTYDSTYLQTSSTTVQPFTPQVVFSAGIPITDTVNWITLTDTFYADSAYRHLVIGGFKPDSLLTTDTFPAGTMNTAYYYIDDVSVEAIPASVSQHEANETLVSIYPHPLIVSSVVHFSNPAKGPHTFSVYNVQGQLVSRITDIRSNSFTIHKDDLASGVYYYRLSNNNNEHSYRGKLMIN